MAVKRLKWATHLEAAEASGLELELTPFHGHLIVLTEGVRSVQTTHPQAAVFGAVSRTDD